MTLNRLRDLADLLDNLPRLSKEEVEAFEADLEAARDELSRLPQRDPWTDDPSAYRPAR
ncbi:MAG TPA: hypothetical protein VFQ45_22770 [Longimicrobium sp.]|nr:hypothetical protein [Longimicrobium sp.]